MNGGFETENYYRSICNKLNNGQEVTVEELQSLTHYLKENYSGQFDSIPNKTPEEWRTIILQDCLCDISLKEKVVDDMFYKLASIAQGFTPQLLNYIFNFFQVSLFTTKTSSVFLGSPKIANFK